MHRGERRRRAKRERKRVRREVNNDSWLFRPINRQIFCAKMPSASSSFLDRKILRQETAFPHHGKPSLLLFLVRKLIRQRKNTSSSPAATLSLVATAPLNALIRNSFDCDVEGGVFPIKCSSACVVCFYSSIMPLLTTP